MKPGRAGATVGAATDPAEPETYAGRMASGVLWLTAQKWAVRITGFVTIAILTRLLTPADFGAVAAASTLLPFFYLLADLGFATFIVQTERVDRRMLSTAWWFSLVAGVVLWAVLFLLAPLMGAVFRAPSVSPVLQVISFSVVLTSVGSVPIALLRRDMRFRTLALQAGTAAFLAQIVAVVVAVAGGGVWALVWQTLAAQFVIVVLAWRSARWVPSIRFSWTVFRRMARFGSKVLGVEFVAAARGWAEAAIISSFLGLSALGYVNIAQRLVQIVQDLTASAIVPVSTVAFARIRSSADRLSSAYLRSLRMTYAAVSAPLTLLVVSAPLVVPLVFGDGWEPSYSLTQVYALAGVLTVAASLDHGLFYGLGLPGRWLLYGLAVDAVTVGTTLVAVHSGLTAVAWGFAGVALGSTVVRWILVGRVLSIRPARVAQPFLFLIAVMGSGVLVGWGVTRLTASLPPLASLVIIGIAVATVYIVITRLLAPAVAAEVVAIARGRWAAVRDRPRRRRRA